MQRAIWWTIAAVLVGALILSLALGYASRAREISPAIDTPDLLEVQDIESVSSLRAALDDARVPLLVRFSPDPRYATVLSWWNSMRWDEQEFRPEELGSMWRMYNRDYWKTPEPTPEIPRDADRIVKDYIIESTAKKSDLLHGAPLCTSHFVARSWLGGHPGLAPVLRSLDLDDPAYTNLKVWFNGRGYSTNAHMDPVDNLSINFVGKKRWVLISPKYHDACYPQAQKQPTGVLRYSIQNPYTVDPEVFPRFHREVKALEIDVGPGDILLVPKGWIHFVNTLEPSFTVTVNLRNDRKGKRDQNPK